ncbi:MAG: DUF2946 family protein [Burkholderiales bacterium]|nr:DUF2946 family protein [Burkholderiales bacterium]
MPALHPARVRRQFRWWLVVLVWGLLAPGVSAALAHARGDFSAWQDICRAPTASGKTAAEPRPVEKALDLLAHGHCAACHLNWTDLVTPPAPAAVPLRNDLAFAAPERFWSAPQTAHAWRPAAARAPPSLS